MFFLLKEDLNVVIPVLFQNLLTLSYFLKKVINSGVIYLKFEKNDCGQKHDLAKIAVYMYEPGQNEI